MIWRYSFLGPRVIQAVYIEGEDYTKGSFVFRDTYPPIMLYVYKNSRREALNFYKPLSKPVSTNSVFEYDSKFDYEAIDED
jgi:hypothetical protein